MNIPGKGTVMQHAKHAIGYRSVLYVVQQRNVRRPETLFQFVVHAAAPSRETYTAIVCVIKKFHVFL